MKKTIDIVLPCYDPQYHWWKALIEFHDFILNYYDVNFIVVNDGSKNGFVLEGIKNLKDKKIPIQLLEISENKGKGFALRKGVAACKADFIIYTDIDFPFVNSSTKEIIDELIKGRNDIVVGVRNQNYYQSKMSNFRKFLSKAFRFFLKSFVKIKITDTQCGLKGFNNIGKQVFLSTTINRYLFDFEFIYLASRSKTITLNCVEVHLKENIKFSKMRPKILIQESINLFSVFFNSKKKNYSL